jgi:hypothetical protein
MGLAAIKCNLRVNPDSAWRASQFLDKSQLSHFLRSFSLLEIHHVRVELYDLNWLVLGDYQVSFV